MPAVTIVSVIASMPPSPAWRDTSNTNTNVLKDTLTEHESQRSFGPLAAAKVWTRGFGGDRTALSGTLQEPELQAYTGAWSSGYLRMWRQERGWLGTQRGDHCPSRATHTLSGTGHSAVSPGPHPQLPDTRALTGDVPPLAPAAVGTATEGRTW